MFQVISRLTDILKETLDYHKYRVLELMEVEKVKEVLDKL